MNTEVADNGTKLGPESYAEQAVAAAAEAARKKLETDLRATAENITNSMVMAARKEATKQGVGSAFHGHGADNMREFIFANTYALLLADAEQKLAATLFTTKASA